MKKMTRKLLAVLLTAVMLCLMLPVAAVAATANNLFVNGDFETGTADGWSTWQTTVISAEAAKDGGYGAHVGGNGGWGGMLNQTVTGLTVGKTYRFSFDYKTNSSGVNVKLCAGTTDKGQVYGYIYADKSVWTEFAVEFEAIEDTAFLNLCGSGTGKAEDMYIDNISLTEVVLGGDDADPDLKMIDTLLDNIKTQGRTAMVGGTLMLDFSISGMEFELDCEGDVYATFNARKLSSTSSTGGVYFTIVVDGVQQARDYCRISSVGETKVLLAEGLSAGQHTFAIYRQSEHQYGEVGVCALSFDGIILPKPADKDLYIEFIGDSVSCGFGNLGNSSKGDGSALWSDGTQAYPYLTAQALNADWSNVSWSGLGCKYGYSSTTMQDVYPAQRYNYDSVTAYDFSEQPDIIVLALGTNDNSKAPDAASKREGLVEMLTLVREKNPDAPIVWIYNMMTSGVNDMIEEIVEEFGGAEAGYYACKLTMNTSGGGWHPNLKGQQTFADELVAFIRANGLDTVTPDEPVPATGEHLLFDTGISRMEMTEDTLGLAFRFSLGALGVTMNGDYEIDLSGATVDATAEGVPSRLLAVGAVVTNDPEVGLVPSRLIRENVSGKTKDVSAVYANNILGDYLHYAVRVTNIPLAKSEAVIYARPYYVYDYNGIAVTVYGEIVSANYDNNINVNDGVFEW